MTKVTVFLVFLMVICCGQAHSVLLKDDFRAVRDIIASSLETKKMPSMQMVILKCCKNTDPIRKEDIAKKLLGYVKFKIDRIKKDRVFPSVSNIEEDLKKILTPQEKVDKVKKERDKKLRRALIFYLASNITTNLILEYKITKKLPSLNDVYMKCERIFVSKKLKLIAQALLDFVTNKILTFLDRLDYLTSQELIEGLSEVLKRVYPFIDDLRKPNTRRPKRNGDIFREALRLFFAIMDRYRKTKEIPTLHELAPICKCPKVRAAILAEEVLKFFRTKLLIFGNRLKEFTFTVIMKGLKGIVAKLSPILDIPDVTTQASPKGNATKQQTQPPKIPSKRPPIEPPTSIAEKPTPNEILNITKMPKGNLTNILQDEVFSKVVEKICSGHVRKTVIDISQLNLQLITACRVVTVNLLDGNSVLDDPDFNKKRKVVLLIAGWPQSSEGKNLIQEMAKAYSCRGRTNFLALNMDHTFSNLEELFNIDINKIGHALSRLIITLSEKVPLENIHVIGQSIGAYIAAFAVKQFTVKTNKKLKRITGLDPFGKCYKPGQKDERLGSPGSLAEVVDLVHTTSGVTAFQDLKGTLDFYELKGTHNQSGCKDVICSHGRAWQYFVETVYPGNDHNFLSSGCMQNNSHCDRSNATMGYRLQYELEGSYYFTAHPKEPYGKEFISDESYHTYIHKCGRCKKN